MGATDPGWQRRFSRLFRAGTRKMLVVPMDDDLLSGPEYRLRDLAGVVTSIAKGGADTTVGFPGLYRHCSQGLQGLGTILNLTASTSRGIHTRKVLASTVEDALVLGVDAVAVHVNIGSQHEPEMLRILGETRSSCQRWGVPLMALMYPRTEPRTERDGADYSYEDLKEKDREKYAELVRHAARIGVELGGDIIHVPFTGDQTTFETVVESCVGVPVIFSCGKMRSIQLVLADAYTAMQAGAAGVSCGRNVFQRTDPIPVVRALSKIVHDDMMVNEAMKSAGIRAEEDPDATIN
jgi:fructose-bisphosphate aldolase/2-amino-3,7-dideoxy-D-threo-hept-6-ulosonate synthase